MPYFRCRNTRCGPMGFDFESAVPVCPKCGTDGRQPKFRACILQQHVAHYDPPSAFAGIGQTASLCKNEEPHVLAARRPFEQLTADPSLVTCPACKAHVDFPPEDKWPEVLLHTSPDWRVGENSGGRLDIRNVDPKPPCSGCR